MRAASRISSSNVAFIFGVMQAASSPECLIIDGKRRPCRGLGIQSQTGTIRSARTAASHQRAPLVAVLRPGGGIMLLVQANLPIDRTSRGTRDARRSAGTASFHALGCRPACQRPWHCRRSGAAGHRQCTRKCSAGLGRHIPPSHRRIPA